MAEAMAAILHLPHQRRITNRRWTFVAIIISAVILMTVVVVGSVLEPAAMHTDLAQKGLPPSLAHPFGTDQLGRDMLMRTVAGLSLSIRVGLFAACASSLVALILAAVAAFGPRWADAVVSWLIDLMMGIPHIILLILISFALGRGFWGVTIGVALTHWPSLTRVLRAEMMQCRTSDYVTAARRLGASRARIIQDHMVPAILPQFIVGLILMFPHAILHEAAITFLGFGLPPEQPAIGIILSESMSYLSAGMWWLAVFPGIALILIVLLFDAVGGGIRTLMDPASSQE